MIYVIAGILFIVMVVAINKNISQKVKIGTLLLDLRDQSTRLEDCQDKVLKYKTELKAIMTTEGYKNLLEEEQSLAKRIKIYGNLEKLLEKEQSLEKQLELYDNQILDCEFGIEDDEQQWCVESIGGYKELIKDEKDTQRMLVRNNCGTMREDINLKIDWDEEVAINKLILSNFNNFCDKAIGNARNKEFRVVEATIKKEYEKINKICPYGMSISEMYLESKISEASMRIEMADRKGELLVNEDEENIEEELSVYEDGVKRAEEGIERANKLIESDSEADCEKGREIKRLLEEKLVELRKKVEEDKDILKNKKKGHIYFVSDVQVPNQIKIGLTRRADPMVRIDELSQSAGTPFKVNVHGIMAVDDAFKVENDFHNYFRSVIIHEKKEWFHITVEEAQKALIEKGFDLRLKDGIFHADYESNKKRLEKKGITI